MISNTVVANSLGALVSSSSILADQRPSTAGGVVAALRAGGPPAFNHFEIVAG